jgi:dihydroorotase
MIARDIELLRYTGSRLHISHLSSKGSVELIRKAKKSGLNITCDVAVANLIWTEEMLESYDSNFKLNPPLRTKADQKALWDGLIDGTIDCIVSDHTPQDTEHKVLEFEYAQHGMIQLQTALSLLLMHAPKIYSYQMLAKHLSINPRTILNQPAVSIREKSMAEFTIFHPTQKWEYNAANNKSLSSNSPILNTTLTGKAVAIFTQNEQFITQS